MTDFSYQRDWRDEVEDAYITRVLYMLAQCRKKALDESEQVLEVGHITANVAMLRFQHEEKHRETFDGKCPWCAKQLVVSKLKEEIRG